MAGDLKTASSAVPLTAVGQFLTTSETILFTASTTQSVKVHMTVTNTSASAVTVNISQVMVSASAGALNRIMVGSLAAAPSSPSVTSNPFPNTVERTFWLGAGDFISGLASASSAVNVVVDVVEFGSASTGALSGIQTDAIGTGGHGTGTCTATNAIGTNSNRYLIASLFVQEGGAFAGWATYSTLTMTCTAGSMTRLVSADFNNGGNIVGSVHLFGLANPTSGTSQTLTATVAATGATMGLVIGSKSYYGVNSSTSPTGAVSSSPSGAATLSLPITSAVGHVPVFAGAFYGPPQDTGASGLRAVYFNGITSGFTVPQWLLMADMIGAASLTATTSNSTQNCAVAVDLIPA